MSAQRIIEIPKNAETEPPYCSDPDCEYCQRLRKMQEQVSRPEADWDNNIGNSRSKAAAPASTSSFFGQSRG